MIKDKKHFAMGSALAISFLVVLAIMFSPVFGGHNAFKASDQLFNSLAKGSAYYIPDLLDQTRSLTNDEFSVTIWVGSEQVAANAVKILGMNGAQVVKGTGELKVSGKLGPLMEAAVKDADSMYFNRAEEISGKYGCSGPEALYAWWKSLKEIQKVLKEQKQFKLDAAIEPILGKGIEMSYNFYQIEPVKVTQKAGILGFALIFYVVYTLWWGFAIFYLFEGIGLNMTKGAKKEV